MKLQTLNQQQAPKFGTNLIIVGALTVLSTVLSFIGSEAVFVGALYIPWYFSLVGSAIGETAGVILGIVCLLPAALFIVMGLLANKYPTKSWFNIVGLVIYGLDTLLLIVDMVLLSTQYSIGDIIADYAMFIIWHALFIFWISKSLSDSKKYVKAIKTAAETQSIEEVTDGEGEQ